MRRALLIPCVALVVACGGGGGDGEQAERTPAPTPTASAQPAPGAVDRARRVITGWSDALRRSDVDAATEFFTVPLVVSQGQSARLSTRARVRLFNAGLPCGSKVTDVTRREDFFVATFLLTERPGQRCDGPGNSAQVAFKLSGDRIREWRQVIQQEQELPPDTESS